MGRGYVKIVAEADGVPVKGLTVIIRSIYGEALYDLQTDENGCTKPVAVDTPDAEHACSPGDTGPRFAMVDAETPGTAFYAPVILRNIPVFDGVTAIQPFTQEPRDGEMQRLERSLAPVFGAQLPHEQTNLCKTHTLSMPEQVTVHMGNPAAEAFDINMPFIDYIKTAASCELYPVWPEAALEANIHCILTCALHRIQSGYYRQAGYPFDITASAAFDPFYVHNRPVYENIAAIVDRALAVYPTLGKQYSLLHTPYCNGVTTACPGLSQWGAVELAQKGADCIEILRQYFGTKIMLANRQATAYFTQKNNAPYRALLYYTLHSMMVNPARHVATAGCCVR